MTLPRTTQHQHALTLTLPATEHVTPTGAGFLPGGEVTLTTQDYGAGQAADNAAQLLDLLYDHGVTSPDLLRFTLRAAGHQAGKTLPAAAALGFEPQSGSQTPRAASETLARQG